MSETNFILTKSKEDNAITFASEAFHLKYQLAKYIGDLEFKILQLCEGIHLLTKAKAIGKPENMKSFTSKLEKITSMLRDIVSKNNIDLVEYAEIIADKYSSISGYIAQLSLRFGNILGQFQIGYSETEIKEIKKLIHEMEIKFGRNVEVMTYKLWIDIIDSNDNVEDITYDMLKNWYHSRKVPRNIYLEYILMQNAAERHEFDIAVKVGDSLRKLTYTRIDSNVIMNYLTKGDNAEKFKGKIVDLNKYRYKGFIQMDEFTKPRLYFEFEDITDYAVNTVVEFEIGLRLRGMMAINIEILKAETMVSQMKEFGVITAGVKVKTLNYKKNRGRSRPKRAYIKSKIEPFDNPKESEVPNISTEIGKEEYNNSDESKINSEKEEKQSKLDEFFE